MRLTLALTSILFVTPAMAQHIELAFHSVGFVIGLQYFGSGSWQSSETIINFKQSDGDVVKCGSQVNTDFRIGAVLDQKYVDDFISVYNDLLYAYLHGAPIRMTVTCKDNLPEVIATSLK